MSSVDGTWSVQPLGMRNPGLLFLWIFFMLYGIILSDVPDDGIAEATKAGGSAD
jgi:hypothetical protein